MQLVVDLIIVSLNNKILLRYLDTYVWSYLNLKWWSLLNHLNYTTSGVVFISKWISLMIYIKMRRWSWSQVTRNYKRNIRPSLALDKTFAVNIFFTSASKIVDLFTLFPYSYILILHILFPILSYYFPSHIYYSCHSYIYISVGLDNSTGLNQGIRSLRS